MNKSNSKPILIREGVIRSVVSEALTSIVSSSSFNIIKAGSIYWHGDNQDLPLSDRDYIYMAEDRGNALFYADEASGEFGGENVLYKLRVKEDMVCPSVEYYINAAIKGGLVPDGEYDDVYDVIEVYGCGESFFWSDLSQTGALDEEKFDVIQTVYEGGDELMVTKRGLSKLEIVSVEVV